MGHFVTLWECRFQIPGLEPCPHACAWRLAKPPSLNPTENLEHRAAVGISDDPDRLFVSMERLRGAVEVDTGLHDFAAGDMSHKYSVRVGKHRLYDVALVFVGCRGDEQTVDRPNQDAPLMEQRDGIGHAPIDHIDRMSIFRNRVGE